MSDLSWKVAHCVLYTAQHLGSFGLPVPLSCFSGAPVELLYNHFFSNVSSPRTTIAISIGNGVLVVLLRLLLMVVCWTISSLCFCFFCFVLFCVPWCWVSFTGVLHRAFFVLYGPSLGFSMSCVCVLLCWVSFSGVLQGV